MTLRLFAVFYIFLAFSVSSFQLTFAQEKVFNDQNCPAWTVGKSYQLKKCVKYSGNYYSVLQAHHSQSDWSPTSAPTLWQIEQPPIGGTLGDCAEWKIGFQYQAGRRVLHEDETYTALQSHTAYEGSNWFPNVSPTLWKKETSNQCEAFIWDDLDTTPGLMGIDNNKNGIRDDIERHIERNFTDARQILWLKKYAKSTQDQILVDKSNEDAVQALNVISFRIYVCLADSVIQPSTEEFNADYFSSILVSLTTNTKERLIAYLEYSKAFNGNVSSLPIGDTCDGE